MSDDLAFKLRNKGKLRNVVFGIADLLDQGDNIRAVGVIRSLLEGAKHQ